MAGYPRMDSEPDNEVRDTLPDINPLDEKFKEFDYFLMEHGGVLMDHTTGKYRENGLREKMRQFGLDEKEQLAYLARQEAGAEERVRTIREALDGSASQKEARRREETEIPSKLGKVRQEIAQTSSKSTIDQPNSLPRTPSNRVGLNTVQLSPKAAKAIQDEIILQTKQKNNSGILGKLRNLFFGKR